MRGGIRVLLIAVTLAGVALTVCAAGQSSPSASSSSQPGTGGLPSTMPSALPVLIALAAVTAAAVLLRLLVRRRDERRREREWLARKPPVERATTGSDPGHAPNEESQS
jgi:hypothetical protein